MDPSVRRGVRANTYVKPNTGVRVGSARPARLKLMQPKGFKKPKATRAAAKPPTGPRLKPFLTDKIRTGGKTPGVRGSRRPAGTGFKKSARTTGRPRTFGTK